MLSKPRSRESAASQAKGSAPICCCLHQYIYKSTTLYIVGFLRYAIVGCPSSLPIMPLDHFSVIVPEGRLEDMTTWVLASNSIFGFKEIMRPVSHVVGLGEIRPYFWVISDPTTKATEEQVREWRKQHVAFTVESG